MNPARRRERGAWILALVLALGMVGWDAVVRTRKLERLSGSYGVAVDSPAVDPASVTGWSEGRRSEILPDRGMDGYHWIMQAQDMAAAGEWRVRRAAYDGAPTGRDVHWAMPFRAGLVVLGQLDRLASGRPLGAALARAAIWSGPLLLALFLIGVVPWLVRCFGAAAGAWVAIGAVAAAPFQVDFATGYVDHHGLANVSGLLCVLFLVRAVTTRNGSDETPSSGWLHSRRWVLASALVGALALWISASAQTLVLIGIGAGVALAAPLAKGTLDPRLLRWWGLFGGVASLLAYLLEYYPGPFGLRLEVNHPLYALAWAAGGEALSRWIRFGSEPPGRGRRRQACALAAALAAVAVLPATMLLAGANVFRVADPFLWRLHDGYIAEFQSLPEFLERQGYRWQALAACLPFALLAPAVRFALDRRRAARVRAPVILAVVPALVLLPFAWSQIRWWSLQLALLGAVAAVACWARPPATPRSRWGWRLGAAVVLAPGLVAAAVEITRAAEMREDDVRSLAERDLAHVLRLRSGDERVVVAASPTTTTALVFHGGLAGVGTLYWENLDGLKAAADVYAAPSVEAAEARVRQLGITHLVVASWDGFEGAYVRLARGLDREAPLPEDAFVVRLLRAPVPPPWLRLYPFRLPDHPALAGQQLRVYEVVARQDPVQALVNTVACHFELGALAQAGPLVAALGHHSEDLRARVLLAQVAHGRRDAGGFIAQVEAVRRLQAQARDLSLDDRVRVAWVLAVAGDVTGARGELQSALAAAHRSAFRRLSPLSRLQVLELIEQLAVPWPDPSLEAVVRELIPPALRPE